MPRVLTWRSLLSAKRAFEQAALTIDRSSGIESVIYHASVPMRASKRKGTGFILCVALVYC